MEISTPLKIWPLGQSLAALNSRGQPNIVEIRGNLPQQINILNYSKKDGQVRPTEYMCAKENKKPYGEA